MSNTAVLQLLRPRVSFAVGAGALFGALYHGGPDPLRGVVAAVGAGILCAGCSALNQIQERDADARMVRTQDRPLVAGNLSLRTSFMTAFLLLVAGLCLFFLAGSWQLLMLGVAVPVIYNGLYTPLKRVTPMALLVGALSGALPPLTGWVGAGGSLFDPSILAVTAIFYLWQVPHFWLLHEKHRNDYRRAGFATLESRLPEGLYKPMLILWVSAYFLGLGCLVYASGPGAAFWLIPPAILLVGAWAVHGVLADKRTPSVAIYASLPLVLVALLARAF